MKPPHKNKDNFLSGDKPVLLFEPFFCGGVLAKPLIELMDKLPIRHTDYLHAFGWNPTAVVKNFDGRIVNNANPVGQRGSVHVRSASPQEIEHSAESVDKTVVVPLEEWGSLHV